MSKNTDLARSYDVLSNIETQIVLIS